jgi:hypothetical protein
MRRYWYLAFATALASALAVLPAVTASAAGAVLTVGSTSGSDVASGDVLTASLKSGTSATFFNSTSGTTGVVCTTSSFSATASSNPTAPGTATASLTAQSFGSCTTNVTGTTSVQSITVDGLPYDTSISSGGSVSITKPGGSVQTTVVIGTVFGPITCIYEASSLSGTASNADNSLQFTNAQFTKTSGPGTCFSTAFFSATYAPVVDTNQGNQNVITN